MTNSNEQDEHFLKLAMQQAEIAEENGDVPIGAVIVHQNQIIAKASADKSALIRV